MGLVGMRVINTHNEVLTRDVKPIHKRCLVTCMMLAAKGKYDDVRYEVLSLHKHTDIYYHDAGKYCIGCHGDEDCCA